MKTVLSVLLWLPVAAIKIVLVVLGVIVVPLGMIAGHVPKLYAADPNRPWTAWEMMIRNPVNGSKRLVKHPDDYAQRGEVLEAPFTDKAFQWRFRRAGLLSSLRLLWQYNDRRYGELYVGWKLGSEPPDLGFTLQLRPYAEAGQ